MILGLLSGIWAVAFPFQMTIVTNESKNKAVSLVVFIRIKILNRVNYLIYLNFHVIYSTMIRSILAILLCTTLSYSYCQFGRAWTCINQLNYALSHDDHAGNTNDANMDGTSLLVRTTTENEQAVNDPGWTVSHGAVVRGDSSRKTVALAFTGDEFGDGLPSIIAALNKHQVTGSFFFTGRFYRNPKFQPAIKRLYQQHNYLGPHSNAHLLYADWTRRDSTLVSADSFRTDLAKNLASIHALGIDTTGPHYFIPPYEWWNDTVAAWSSSIGWQLVNFTPGIRTNADYTYPEMGKSYVGSEAILQSVKQFEASRDGGLNGAIILIHAGTDPRRKDKLYNRLDELLGWLENNGYKCVTIPQLLAEEVNTYTNKTIDNFEYALKRHNLMPRLKVIIN